MTDEIQIKKELLSPPGDTIQETLDETNMSQAELAERIGRPKEKVNDLIKGRERITTGTAYRLETVFGIPASFWINRENEYRKKLFEIEQQEFFEKCIEWLKGFPVNEMKKYGYLPNIKDKKKLVSELLKFFGVATPEQWNQIYVSKEVAVSFRISLADTKSPEATSAWLRMGDKQAEKLNLQKYDKQKFNNILQDIKRLSFDQPSDFATRLQEICASCGVAVVYTRNLPKAPISGATRWQHNKPIIQLSGRYKANDHFWFTFCHEAGHILLHGKKEIFLEDVEESLIDKKKEEEANRFAERWLFPDKQRKEILKYGFSPENVKYLAQKFKIHPGIIIGQLQHKKIIKHSEGNELKEKICLFEKDT